MPTDLLSDVLRALRLKGTVYFQADFQTPWGMSIPAREIAAFHVVASGACWLRGGGGEMVRLEAGDIALLPHGSAHALLHEPGAEIRPVEELLSESSGAAQASERTTLVCGHFEYDRQATHPLFGTLPELVRVRTQRDEQAGWLAAAAKLAAAESAANQDGSAVVVDRLAEALLLQTLRLFLQGQEQPGCFLAAVREPAIGTALAAVHDEPARRWSVDGLAREAGLSRSSFAERFRELVGESPMRYVFRWRMLAAREQLREPGLSIAQAAEQVGYESEFAFAKAFKRHFGFGPGAARRVA